jgi:hypothetical protein
MTYNLSHRSQYRADYFVLATVYYYYYYYYFLSENKLLSM